MSTNAIMSAPKGREHGVVSQEEWIAARKELLKREKEFTRLRDQLSAERRKLPWVKVEKNYVFDAPGGKVPLVDLFAGRSQLVIYHFMFGPDWQEGCPSCSYSTYGRGLEPLVGTYMTLDLVPKGRDEDHLGF